MAPNQEAQSPARLIKVLVIDDDQEQLDLIKKTLSGKGFQVTTTTTGEEGIDLFQKDRPKLVILDMVLKPPCHGPQVLKAIRSNETTAFRVPVILITGHRDQECFLRQCLRLGVEEKLFKPFSLAELAGKAEKAIRKSSRCFQTAFSKVFRGKRILAADDDESVREFVDFVLKGQGCEVLLAKNGQEAFKTAQSVLPDLILMDLYMPVCDGAQSLLLLKQDPGTQNIPVVAMSGREKKGEEDVLETLARSQGCANFVHKPFAEEELLRSVFLSFESGQKSRLVMGKRGCGKTEAPSGGKESDLEPQKSIDGGLIKLDCESHTAVIHGNGKDHVDLAKAPKLYRLLEILMLNAETIVSCKDLAEETKDTTSATEDPRVIQRDIQRLKRMLGPVGRASIRAIPKYGVRFVRLERLPESCRDSQN